MSEKTHGGPGRGQGRKPLAQGEQTVMFALRLTVAQREKLALLGGAEWVRGKIDKAKTPKLAVTGRAQRRSALTEMLGGSARKGKEMLVYHYHAIKQVHHGKITNLDGIARMQNPVLTMEDYRALKTLIAEVDGGGIGGPDGLTICSLTLLTPNAKVSGAGTASAGLPGWQANGETE